MSQWYVIQTKEGTEKQAEELIRKTVPHNLWVQCRVLKKEKLFRGEGKLMLSHENMFPGYLFIKTNCPKMLMEYLEISREYPKILNSGKEDLNPIEDQDLCFLQTVCGEDLERSMSLSEVETDDEGNLIHIRGILKNYCKNIIKKRLRKRYVLAQVDLFQRKETVLFGIYLAEDKIIQKNTNDK